MDIRIRKLGQTQKFEYHVISFRQNLLQSRPVAAESDVAVTRDLVPEKSAIDKKRQTFSYNVNTF